MSRAGKYIYKRKDKRWEGRYIKYYENGRAKYGSVYGHTCQEVKDKLAKLKERISKRKLNSPAGNIEKISKNWLAEISPLLKESSINKYEDILQNYIIPQFQNSDLSDITNENLIDFSGKLLNTGGVKGKGLSPSTVKQILSVMNCLRIHALRHNYTVNYSTECVTIKKAPDEIRVFSEAEEQKLIEYLCKNYNLTSLGILLCLFSGLRVGEICALTWDDFDFNSGTFSVTKTMQRVRIKGDSDKKSEVKILEPKSRCSVRTIPIPDNLKLLLLSEQEKGAFILTGNRDKYIEPRTLQNRFKRILEKAGIAKANYHTTRHSYATRCIEQGVDVKCLSEMLGHASVSITLNRYVHPSMDLKTSHLSKLTHCYPINIVDAG